LKFLFYCHPQIESFSVGEVLYWEEHLCRLRRKKDQVLNLEERRV